MLYELKTCAAGPKSVKIIYIYIVSFRGMLEDSTGTGCGCHICRFSPNSIPVVVLYICI